MPRCAVRHVKLVAEADLPILPFLAPRVFQPWPVPLPRSSRALQTASRHVTFSTKASRHVTASTKAPRHVTYSTEASRHVTASTKAPRHVTTSTKVPRQGHQDNDSRTCFSTLSEQQAGRTGRDRNSKKKPETRQESARSLLASQWYQAAVAPAHSQTSDQSGWKTKIQAKKEEGPKRLSRQVAQKREWKARTTVASILKSRWTASKRGPELARTKWVSVGHPVRRRSKSPQAKEVLGYVIEDDFLVWNHHFAKLNRRFDSRAETKPGEKNTPVLNFDASKWASKIRKNPEATKNLEKLLGKDWRKKWMHAMLWTLANSVDDAARLLEVTHVEPYLSASCIADCLNYLSQHYSRVGIDDEALDRLVRVFCTLMERPGSAPLNLTGSPLRRLQTICNGDQIFNLYESAVVNGVNLHWNTRLHFATYLAQHGRYDQALDSLLDAVTDGADVTSPQFESNCATILRKAADQPDGLRVGLRMVQNLADIGVKLNVQLCNIVMLSAVEADDLKTAFSIYHSLVEHNLSADKYTHAILLKGCKSAIQDSETLNTTIRRAIANTEILKSPVVATEIIHCLYLHHYTTNSTQAFSTITEAYIQLFDARYLINLGVLPAECSNRSSERMEPTIPVLGIMVAAFLRETLTSSTHGNQRHLIVQNVYQHWYELVKQGKQPYSSLAETDHLFNAFLLAFTSHASTLPSAAEVIRHMQTPLTPQTSSPTSSSPEASSTVLCKPTLQSWSIFLHGFSKHGKLNLAEQVLTYMRGRGLEPNVVTWNSLVGGYVRSGDTEGAVEAFRRMRGEGWKADGVTERVLSRVRLDFGGVRG